MEVLILTEKNYEDVANAVIVCAVKDYRKSVRQLKQNPQDFIAMMTKYEIERFFCSEWFGALTMLDGYNLLRKLKQTLE